MANDPQIENHCSTSSSHGEPEWKDLHFHKNNKREILKSYVHYSKGEEYLTWTKTTQMENTVELV